MGSGEAEDLDLGPMVRKGEVAWLHKHDMPGSNHMDSTEGAAVAGQSSQQHVPGSPQGNPKKRKVIYLNSDSQIVALLPVPYPMWECNICVKACRVRIYI